MPTMFESLNDRADVEALITGAVRESEVLEYKTASQLFTEHDRKELAKDTSAMANSAGGLIIYGVRTDQHDKTRPVAIEGIDLRNFETFDRVLNSQVKPPLIGVRKKLLPPGAPEVMVVEVPGSEDPPHQSLYDKRYYRRSGTESIPMEHDLVALLFGRTLGPILDVGVEVLQKIRTFAGDELMSDEGHLRVTVENNGRRVGRYVQVVLVFAPAPDVTIKVHSGNATNIDRLYQGRQVLQFSENIGVFHPRMRVSILELGVTITKGYAEAHGEEPFIEWTAFADGMNPRSGVITMTQLRLITPGLWTRVRS